ncbi:hypothetical protein K1T71_000801 [Dendrolimus kikuchii]|uniref:Uncharacterized protein n=1 Tax=Dendrolimus kikuchii TaxID=765133 RepID=A0ACC1DKS5_9NEOP|nr:hypothetical protein K1T71_000801 [Dendrolimus kikuchii]
MNSDAAEDDYQHIRNVEEVESPRKRMRLDNSGRKSWSLMDRKTDYEVLQEMGVSLLEPDDNDTIYDPSSSGNLPHKPTAKRKRDIENVNPNVNSTGLSPRGKASPRSPRAKICSPGPSKARSPRSHEKHKPLQQSDHNLLETSLPSEYLIDEETPLGQSVGAHYLPTATAGPNTNTDGKKRECCTSESEPYGPDSFSALSDEMMLSIFRWLPKRTLAHSMLVCKRWYRVACDETLWQRLDLGNKTLNKDALGRILARKPIIVRFASSEIGEWHPTSLSSPSRIQYLDLSMATLDQVTLDSLLTMCPGLKKLSLENLQLQDSTCAIIGKCVNMETLNLTMAQGVTAAGLGEIFEGCRSLQSLNISWCNLDEISLEVLVTGLPSRLQRLNLGGARILTDDMVACLCRCCTHLLELDLSDCSRLSACSVQALAALQRLEHLALSRCYLLPAQTLTKLSCMVSLQYLEVWGMLQTHSLSLLKEKLPGIQINQFMFSAIARPTVGTRRTSIWGLRTRD